MTVEFKNNIYFLNIFKKFSGIILGLFSIMLLNRILEPKYRGEYAYILSMVNMLSVILNLGISVSYSYFKRKKDKDYLKIFYSLSLIQLIISLIISFVLLVIVKNNILFAVVLMTGISVFRIQLNYYSIIEDAKANMISTVVSSVINLFFLLYIFLFNKNNLELTYLAYTLKDVMFSFLLIKKLKLRIQNKKTNKKVYIEILKYGIIPMLTTLLISVNYKIDIIILKFLDVKLYNIGLYTTSVSLAEYAWLIPDIFKEVLINKNAEKDDIDSMTFSIRILTILMAIIYIIILIFGKSILSFVFGESYVGGYKVTLIIFLGIHSMVYVKIIGTLYTAQGEWKFYRKVLSYSVILNIALNFALIPFFDIYGAALASIFSYSLAGGLFIFDFKKKYNVKFSELLLVQKKDVMVIIRIINRFTTKRRNNVKRNT